MTCHELEDLTAGQLIQLKDVLHGTKTVDIGDSWDEVVMQFTNVLTAYKNAVSTASFMSTANPSAPKVAVRVPSKRMLSNIEKAVVCHKQQKLPTCSFCGSADHSCQSICPQMHHWGKRITDVPEFIGYNIMEHALFSNWNDLLTDTLLKSLPTEAKHVVLHKMYAKFNHHLMHWPQFVNTIYQATILGSCGLPFPN